MVRMLHVLGVYRTLSMHSSLLRSIRSHCLLHLPNISERRRHSVVSVLKHLHWWHVVHHVWILILVHRCCRRSSVWRLIH